MADLSARSILAGTAAGPIIAAGEALSFWGGVDPAPSTVLAKITALDSAHAIASPAFGALSSR